MSERTHKPSWKLMLALVVFAVIVACCAAMIVKTNAEAPAQHSVKYGVNEPMPFYAEGQSKGIEITSHGAFLLTWETLGEYDIPEDQGSLKQMLVDGDALAVVVVADMTNQGTEDLRASPTYLTLQTGSWANGVSTTLFRSLNGGHDPALTLSPGESVTVLIPFEIWRSSFGYNGYWDTLAHRDYQLITAIFPDKVYCDLGTPRLESEFSQMVDVVGEEVSQ